MLRFCTFSLLAVVCSCRCDRPVCDQASSDCLPVDAGATGGGAGGGGNSCDDGNPCTIDRLADGGGCAHEAGNAGAVCRAPAGTCDLAEVCDGSGVDCPPDSFAPAATSCRASIGTCDFAETCTGSSAACPTDIVAVGSTVCRPSLGPCDPSESCDGSSGACPADALAGSLVVCRASIGLCDAAERCSGASPSCPSDQLSPMTTVCRPSIGGCDPEETCTGTSSGCPPDALAPLGGLCRAVAGTCDVEERCDGVSGLCPADAVLSSAVECRPKAGDCDLAEKCSGLAPKCPSDAFVPPFTLCRAADACNEDKACPGTGPTCALHTDAPFNGSCYYLDGTNGACLPDYALAPQSTLLSLTNAFIGLGVKTSGFDNCCIKHSTQASDGQDYGLNATDCGAFGGPWSQGPVLGGHNCTDANENQTHQLTLCGRLPKRLFVTATTMKGNMGGLAGADALCMADPAAAAAGATFKALLVDGVTRRASVTPNQGDGQLDWVLLPNMRYVRASDGLDVMVTNEKSLVFFGSLTNPIAPLRSYWSGLFGNWTTAGEHCSGWTTVAGNGNYASGSATYTPSIYVGAVTCGAALSNGILCIEQ